MKVGSSTITRQFIIPLLMAVISGAAIQAGGGLVWGGKVIARIEQLEQKNIEQDRYADRINERGSAQLPIIDQRLKTLEEIVKQNNTRIDLLQQQNLNINPITQVQIDTIKQTLARLEENGRHLKEAMDRLQFERK